MLELTNAWSLPEGFVYVDEVIPSIKQDIRYFGVNNFVGRPVNGYHTNRAILTKSAASALKAVQEELSKFGLGLLEFDAYSPQQAVDDFVAWSKDDKDTKSKSANYPQVSKNTLISEGFIAEYSGHSRGSTIDLTIVSENTPFKQLGFVVFEDDEQIELAGTITAGMCNNSITIPKKMLTKIKEIKVENKLRKTKRKAAPAMDRKEVTGEVSTTDGQGLTQLSDG